MSWDFVLHDLGLGMVQAGGADLGGASMQMDASDGLIGRVRLSTDEVIETAVENPEFGVVYTQQRHEHVDELRE